MSISRQWAEAEDSRDPLSHFRREFIGPEDKIYMDGNSLGKLPLRAASKIASVVQDEWGREMVGGWHDWIDLPTRLGDEIARLIGAEPGEVVVCDSTSVNLFKLAMAAVGVRQGRRVIVTDFANFPSDQYVLQSVARLNGMKLRRFESDPVYGPDTTSLGEALDGNVALVSLSHVGYKNAALADMNAITSVAHGSGALMLWDLCHSVGALPVSLGSSGVDLAVGCTYKYLNSGPGAPAFLYVRRELQDELVQPIWGWFGQRQQFEMDAEYSPASGIRRFMAGTPPIVSMTAVEEGVRMTLEAGIDLIRTKSVALTEMMVALHGQWLTPLGVELASPKDPARRGSHVGLRHPDAYQICRALIDGFGVIPDFREPDVIRYGVAPLYTSFTEVWDAMESLRICLEDRSYSEFPSDRGRVT